MIAPLIYAAILVLILVLIYIFYQFFCASSVRYEPPITSFDLEAALGPASRTVCFRDHRRPKFMRENQRYRVVSSDYVKSRNLKERSAWINCSTVQEAERLAREMSDGQAPTRHGIHAESQVKLPHYHISGHAFLMPIPFRPETTSVINVHWSFPETK